MRKNRWAGRIIKNCKKRGEWAELVFAMRGIEQGLSLGRPWGESSGYDFTVDQGQRIVRVQVKSTIFKEAAEGYSCSLKDSKGPYKKGSFEFVAAYVIPEDVWFIIPEKIIRGMWSVGCIRSWRRRSTGSIRRRGDCCAARRRDSWTGLRLVRTRIFRRGLRRWLKPRFLYLEGLTRH